MHGVHKAFYPAAQIVLVFHRVAAYHGKLRPYPAQRSIAHEFKQRFKLPQLAYAAHAHGYYGYVRVYAEFIQYVRSRLYPRHTGVLVRYMHYCPRGNSLKQLRLARAYAAQVPFALLRGPCAVLNVPRAVYRGLHGLLCGVFIILSTHYERKPCRSLRRYGAHRAGAEHRLYRCAHVPLRYAELPHCVNYAPAAARHNQCIRGIHSVAFQRVRINKRGVCPKRGPLHAAPCKQHPARMQRRVYAKPYERRMRGVFLPVRKRHFRKCAHVRAQLAVRSIGKAYQPYLRVPRGVNVCFLPYLNAVQLLFMHHAEIIQRAAACPLPVCRRVCQGEGRIPRVHGYERPVRAAYAVGRIFCYVPAAARAVPRAVIAHKYGVASV